jgi:uncharacterized OsmC-like protein
MRLTVQHVDGMRFLATEGAHSVVTDAAPQDGGAGAAMSAPQMFVAALGACILEFVLNSCRLHDTPIVRLSVDMAWEEASQPRRLDGLQATIRLDPEPPEDVKRRLTSVARHATLVSTLVDAPRVDITFAGKGG